MTINVLGVRGATDTTAAGAATCSSFTSTAGSTIVVVGGEFNSTGAANGDVTDSKGNSYTLAVSNFVGGGGVGTAIYYNIAGTRGASHTVTFDTVAAAGQGNIAVLEFSAGGTVTFDSTTDATAIDNSTPYDVTAAAAISGTQIAVYGTTLDTNTNTAWTQPTGYSDIYSEPNGSSFLVTIGSYKNGETGTPTVGAASAHSPSNARQVFATFKEDTSTPVQDPNSAGTPPYPYVVESIGAAITTSQSPSVTFTASPAPGDWVVLFPSSTTTATITEPSGWSNPLGAGVDVESDAHQICCVYHQVTAAESAAGTKTYTATNLYDTTETGYVHGHLIRSADPTTLIDTAVSTFDSANTVTPHVFAAITPAVQAGLILASVAKDATGAYSSVPGGMTQLLASNTNQGRWTGYYSALGTKGTAVGPTNITPSAGDEYASITLSITTNYDAYHPPTPNPFGNSPYLLQWLDDRYLGERNPGVAGPQNYTIDLAGTLTSSSLLAKADSKPFAGSSTPAGSAAKLIGKPGLAGTVTSSGTDGHQENKGLAGTVTSAGSLAKAMSKALAGSITPAGALAKLISKPGLAGTVTSSGSETETLNKGLAGTVTSSGSDTKAISKGLSGSVTSAGALAKLVAKALAGTITSDGALSNLKASLLTFTGTITSSGSLANQTGKGLTAATSPSGAIGKSITKPGLAGSVTSSGSETGTMNKGLAGSVSSSGSFVSSLAKAFTGTITSAASIVKFISKGLTGSETPTGSLDISSGNQLSLSGTVSPEGSLANAVSKALTGSTSLSGAIAKLISKGPTGSITPSGDLTTSSGTNLSLSGSVSPAGALSRAIDKALGGTITPSGSLTKLLARAFSGDISSSGAPSKQVQKGYSATITSAGAIVQVLGKGLSGTISGVGSLAKFVAKSLTGLLTSSGVVTLVNPDAVTVVPGPFDAHWEICLDGPPTLFVPDQSFDLCLDEERWIVE